MATTFRYITPTDVDSFIQFPDALTVDARDMVLTVEEDTYLKNYDRRFQINDYVIYCETPKSTFFDPSGNWTYRIEQQVVDGIYVGPHVVDASNNAHVIRVADTKAHLGTTTDRTRFSHYKECNQFFKYSFKVGAPATVQDAELNSRPAQLYAVYVDKTTGEALPYQITTAGSGATQTPETKLFYYATLPSGLSPAVQDASGSAYTVVCPPDSEFLNDGNLAIATDASGLVIRAVNEGMTTYAQENFALYTDDADRALVLYYVWYPADAKPYLGEQLRCCFRSYDVLPIRDVVDASGLPVRGLTEAPVDAFKFVAESALPVGATAVAFSVAPRMYLPVSKFVVATGNESLDLPFQFEIPNKVDTDTTMLTLGGRIMQIVSEYLFDASTLNELAYFPFLRNEAKELVDKIIDALAVEIRDNAETRNEVLRQMVIRYGRRYFEESALFNNGTEGAVLDVVNRVDEMFLYFTVSVRTAISNRSKDRVEAFELVQVPVVIRVFA